MAKKDKKEEVTEEVAEEEEEVVEEAPVEEAERPWTKKYNPDTGLYDIVYLD
jgi:hypothetical protein